MIPQERISDDMLRRMLDNDDMPMMPPPLNTRPAPKPTFGLEGYPLASVYAPIQRFHKLYDKDMALAKGTLFVELDLPFMGESMANKGGMCRD